MNEFLFLKISNKHLSQIISIENSCFQNPWTMDHFLSEISNPNSINICIQYLKYNIIGYCFNYVILGDMHITNLCIHPSHQNKRLGNKLLKLLISLAIKNHIKRILLEVRESNINAIKLYEGSGFIYDCYRNNFYSNGDGAYMMHLKI